MSGREPVLFFIINLVLIVGASACSSIQPKPADEARPSDFELEASTPLIRAAAEGRLSEVKRLIGIGADANESNDQGITPLMAAARRNHAQVVEWLLHNSADPKFTDANGSTALHFAALGSSPDSVQILAKSGAPIELKDSFDLTALMIAVRFASLATVKELIKVGASPYTADPNGWTALHFTIPRGDASIFEFILDQNPTLDQLDRDGMTLPMIAESYHQPEFVKRLVSAGAPPTGLPQSEKK